VANLSPDKIVVGAIGAAIGAAIGSLLPGGLTSAIGVLLTSAGSITGLIFSLMYKRYLGILAASAHDKNSTDRNTRAEWQAYERLRKSLRGGNIAARLYADWLTKFLDSVDRFFGDAGKADQTLFPRAFGLKTPAPLWTAPAFDRCLLLALLYPIASIFIIWAVSGHVGPAEAALGLNSNLPDWHRGIWSGSMLFLGFAIKQVWRTDASISVVWLVICLGASVLALGGAVFSGVNVARVDGDLASADAGAIRDLLELQIFHAVGLAVALAVVVAGAFTGVGAVAVTVAVAGTLAGAPAGAVVGAFPFAIAVDGASPSYSPKIA
jgi:hypothetical protein